MLANHEDGTTLFCIEPEDAGRVLRFDKDGRLVMRSDLLEEQDHKTGVYRDKVGRRYRLQDGVRVPLGEEEPSAPKVVNAKFNGQEVQVVQSDPALKVARVRAQDGTENVVRTDQLDFGGFGPPEEEPEETPPGGFQFYSPNVKEDVKFDQAVSALGTTDQRKFLDASDDILEHLGLTEHHGENAVGDWLDGAENSVVQTIDGDVDAETSRYTAALIGQMAQQKAVLNFKSDPDGKDAVYEMEVRAPMGQVRQTLGEKGIAFRTLVPEKDGCKVVVFDEGGKLFNKVLTVGDAFNVTIHETRGTGEFIGGPDRASADRAYRKVIDAWESSGRPKYDPRTLIIAGVTMPMQEREIPAQGQEPPPQQKPT